jgi:hypothetical protein
MRGLSAIRCFGPGVGALAVLLLAACAVPAPVVDPANQRPFRFGADTFAFNNQLEWRYRIDPQAGTTTPAGPNPGADYTLRCFVLARSARQFFQFARFDPRRPPLDDAGYRRLIDAVVDLDPSERPPSSGRIVIPGYADLHSFSRAHEALLKDALGSAVDSYLQRGNWRMVFPFSREHQQATAQALEAEVRADRPPVVHLVRFPDLSINHAVLLYGVSRIDGGLRFQVYDPNDDAHPAQLDFDEQSQSFRFPANFYFAGGAVDVYEVYKSALY